VLPIRRTVKNGVWTSGFGFPVKVEFGCVFNDVKNSSSTWWCGACVDFPGSTMPCLRECLARELKEW